jgi:hypothetical protein
MNFEDVLINPLKKLYREEHVAVNATKSGCGRKAYVISQGERRIADITVELIVDNIVFEITKFDTADTKNAARLTLKADFSISKEVIDEFLDEVVRWSLNEWFITIDEYMVCISNGQISSVVCATTSVEGKLITRHHAVLRLPDSSRTHFDVVVTHGDKDKDTVVHVETPIVGKQYEISIPDQVWKSYVRSNIVAEIFDLGAEIRLAEELERLREKHTTKIKNWIEEVCHE